MQARHRAGSATISRYPRRSRRPSQSVLRILRGCLDQRILVARRIELARLGQVIETGLPLVRVAIDERLRAELGGPQPVGLRLTLRCRHGRRRRGTDGSTGGGFSAVVLALGTKVYEQLAGLPQAVYFPHPSPANKCVSQTPAHESHAERSAAIASEARVEELDEGAVVLQRAKNEISSLAEPVNEFETAGG